MRPFALREGRGLAPPTLALEEEKGHLQPVSGLPARALSLTRLPQPVLCRQTPWLDTLMGHVQIRQRQPPRNANPITPTDLRALQDVIPSHSPAHWLRTPADVLFIYSLRVISFPVCTVLPSSGHVQRHRMGSAQRSFNLPLHGFLTWGLWSFLPCRRGKNSRFSG